MDRLNILLEGNIITKSTYQLALIVQEYMVCKYHVSPSSLEMMITHLAMATQRILKNEIVGAMDEEIVQSIFMDDMYEEANVIMKKISEIANMEYPQSEEMYMLLHICNTLKGGK